MVRVTTLVILQKGMRLVLFTSSGFMVGEIISYAFDIKISKQERNDPDFKCRDKTRYLIRLREASLKNLNFKGALIGLIVGVLEIIVIANFKHFLIIMGNDLVLADFHREDLLGAFWLHIKEALTLRGKSQKVLAVALLGVIVLFFINPMSELMFLILILFGVLLRKGKITKAFCEWIEQELLSIYQNKVLREQLKKIAETTKEQGDKNNPFNLNRNFTDYFGNKNPAPKRIILLRILYGLLLIKLLPRGFVLASKLKPVQYLVELDVIIFPLSELIEEITI